MVHTLIEYAKTMPADSYERAMVELFPQELDFLEIMPFASAPSGAFRWQEEAGLPENMGFRAINETPAEGHGVVNDRVEQTFPIAGNIDVDRVLIARHGPQRRALERRLSIKKKMKVWADTFIGGDNLTSPREFSGLKSRLKAVGSGTSAVDGTNYESRILANSTASGGGALSLSVLDRAIGLVENPNAIIMPKALLNRLPAAERDTGVSGFVQQTQNEMGRDVTKYAGIPIYTGYGLSPYGEFLGFNEVGLGGGAASTTSIYVVRFSEDGVCGLEQSPMQVTDMGLRENGVHYRDNIEHDVGMGIFDRYAAIRVSSVTNAAIVK